MAFSPRSANLELHTKVGACTFSLNNVLHEGGTGATSLGGAGVTAGAGGTGGAGATGPGGARTRGAGAAGAGGVGGARAGDLGVGDHGAGGNGAGGAGAGGTRAGDSRAGGTSAGGAGARGVGVGDPGVGAGGTGAGDLGARGAGAGGAGMWIFRGVDFFHTFSPTPKMTTLWVLLHVAAQRDYKLQSLDFSTDFLQGSLHEEIRLHRPPGFTLSFPAGTQWSLWRPIYGLRQAPRKWHNTLRTTLAALGFAPSTADPSLFLRTNTSLPPFYVLVYVDDLVFAIADTEALALVKSEL
ncbi:unnamed protein product [Closterium sp. NIES-54]